MSEYIKKEDAVWYAVEVHRAVYSMIRRGIAVSPMNTARELMMYQPSADVVEPKRGEWIGDKCSVCGNERAWYGCNPPFCPDCGADMREKDDE